MFESLFEKPFGLSVSEHAVSVVQLPETQGEKEFTDPKAFGPTLSALLQELGIHSKKCVLSLPLEASFEHVFSVPQNALPLQDQIASVTPLPPEDIAYDVATHPHALPPLMFTAATSRLGLKNYVDAIRNCGITIQAIEPGSLSLLRAIPFAFKPNESALLVHRTPRTLTWFLLWDGFIFDSNRIPAGSHASNTLLEDLKTSKTFFEKTTSQTLTSGWMAGPEGSVDNLASLLAETLSMKFQAIQDYRLPLKNQGSGTAEAAGAAFRAAGIDFLPFKIDLLKNTKN